MTRQKIKDGPSKTGLMNSLKDSKHHVAFTSVSGARIEVQIHQLHRWTVSDEDWIFQGYIVTSGRLTQPVKGHYDARSKTGCIEDI